MKTLENKIVDLIIELDDYNGDEMRRQQLLESFADEATEDFMSELGLKTDASFAIIRPAVLKAIESEIDWAKVDEELDEVHQNTMEWFHDRMEAIFS